MFYHQRKTGTFCFNPCLINTFKPSSSVVSRVPLAVALIPTDTTGTPSSTIIDQDAPSASTSPTTHEIQSPVIHQVYQMKSRLYFLNDVLWEEVYALRTWYDLLSKFLLSQKFLKGDVDPTLFIRKEGKDILLNPRGIFINQSKYALKMINKYDMESSDPIDTPMVEITKLDEDPQGVPVDPTCYRKVLSRYAVTMSSTPDLSTLMLDIISSKSRWRTSMSPETLKCLAEEEEE
ncbi:hypothetical protein Tco_0173686 [Tanacetum coccineum]